MTFLTKFEPVIKVAFITRSTLYKIHGGSGIQITQTARQLEKLGVKVKICLTHEKINYDEYDLLHFFDIIRPANILYHIHHSSKPFVVSPVLVDYREFDKYHRRGISGFIFRLFPPHANEYLKTIARWVMGNDSLRSKSYLWKGHKNSIREILRKASLVLPNSKAEYQQLEKEFNIEKPYFVIPNGIDPALFAYDEVQVKEKDLVISAARLEGIKNQLNLVRAINNTRFRLIIIGQSTTNQRGYSKQCREAAASNIKFVGEIPQQELVNYYKKAKVHVLPSWFETCGLSSLEAAAMGCNIVITDKGFTREYFGDEAFYCDPADEKSIYQAIERAAVSPVRTEFQKKILKQFTWEQAAIKTLEAYKSIINL